MKLFYTAFFLILLVSTPALSQWKQGDKTVNDSSDRKSVNGFGAHILVVKDAQAFIAEWVKPEAPKIKPATTVTPTDPIGILVLFAGCKTDHQGNCNSEVDYTLYKPDGTVYAERKNQPLWKEQAPPPPIIQLGRAILSLRMGKNAPSGEYLVKAKVYDLNADISFELQTTFKLK